MPKWIINILTTFAGTLAALAAILAFIWWRFVVWLNTPLGEHLPLPRIAQALDPGYNLLWWSFVALVVIGLIELGVIAYALLRLRQS